MSTKTAKDKYVIGPLGTTSFGLSALYDSLGHGEASIAISFGDVYGIGIKVGFHASTTEAREFARHLVEYADAADKAQAEAQAVAA